jgi:antitoxin YefM
MQAITINQFRTNIEKYLGDVSKSEDLIIVIRATEEDAVVIMSMKDGNTRKLQ